MLRALRDFLLGVAVLLLALEILLRLLPVSTATRTGYHVDPAILGYPPRHQWRISTGWDLRNAQQLRANNLGFAADRDFVPDPRAVALIGDSYVEASMLDVASRPAAQLERLLGQGRSVYAFGGPGSSLLDYVERIRFARERTDVRDVVILMEAGDVRQSLCGSGNVHSSCLDPATLEPRTVRAPAPSGLKVVARESALAQYLFGQIRLDGRRLWGALFRRQTPDDGGAASVARQPEHEAVLAHVPAFVEAVSRRFFEAALPQVPGRLVIVVDGRRVPSGSLDTGLSSERKAFIEIARSAGVTVIDAEPIYESHADGSERSLQVGPYDGHLNALGVELVMGAAARAFK